jgi:hypothetical protein
MTMPVTLMVLVLSLVALAFSYYVRHHHAH